jgi:hypothetical protein
MSAAGTFGLGPFFAIHTAPADFVSPVAYVDPHQRSFAGRLVTPKPAKQEWAAPLDAGTSPQGPRKRVDDASEHKTSE